MLAAIVLLPGWRMWVLTTKLGASTRATAIVSPRARPSPRMIAPTSPLREYGNTAMRIISHRVAPSATAASLWAVGVWRNTSRETAAMMGSTMMARITEAAKMDRP